MISDDDQKYILTRAYVPEHSVDLITRVSGGEPFLINDFFCCRRDDWLIVVGYPLEGEFSPDRFENIFARIKNQFHPKHLSLMAPELPPSISPDCQEKQSDYFYTLDMKKFTLKAVLKRVVNKALKTLSVERSTAMDEPHDELAREFIKRVNPPPRIQELLSRMSNYVGSAAQSVVLNAWDNAHKLAAYYIIDLAANNFSTYVVGCHSKKHYTPGASDLLCYEMIKMSQEYGKRYIHLGLGVNEGIIRFKRKWGGRPTIKYELCELVLKKPSLLETIFALR